MMSFGAHVTMFRSLVGHDGVHTPAAFGSQVCGIGPCLAKRHCLAQL